MKIIKSIIVSDSEWREASKRTLDEFPETMVGYSPSNEEMREIVATALGYFRAKLLLVLKEAKYK